MEDVANKAREIVGQMARERYVERIVRNCLVNSRQQFDERDLDDLYQEVYCSLLLKPPETVVHLWESRKGRKREMDFFVSRVCITMLYGSGSPWRKKYLLPRQREIDINEVITREEGEQD